MSSSLFDSESIDISGWIKKDRLEKTIEDTAKSDSPPRSSVQELLQPKEAPPSPPSPFFEQLEALMNAMVADQLKKPDDLLKLNSSRREGMGRFLTELSQTPEPLDPQLALRHFVRPDRSEAEQKALKQLFRQIALAQIAKAALLLSWRKRAGARLERADLKDLTASVERDLRSYVNLQTSTCQLIQQNFYSWYKLTPETQSFLWIILESVADPDCLKDWLLHRARILSAETLGERQRYGEGFYRNLWKSLEKHRLLSFRGEQRIGFSPTLRDGSLFEHAPPSIQWVGFESLSFELLFGEVRHFWKEPKNPPLWAKGSGLEMSMEQQGSLLLTHSGKLNILKQMDAISCAEVAIISEESSIRATGKGLASQALKRTVDQHSILKKIKQPNTTRGIYQACQTLDKLRQDGILVWAREEVLSEEAGKPALHFLLDHAKILMIADFSALHCKTPELERDLPKVIYVLRRENRLEERKSHRPLLLKAYGSLEGERDLETLFDRAFGLIHRPDQAFPAEPFQLHARVSPVDQREWEQHWFNPKDNEMVDQIEDLKRNSAPLGQFATIRTFNPSLQFSFDKREPHLFPESNMRADTGFYLWVEHSKNGNEIFTAPEDRLPGYLRNNHALFYIAPLKPEWNQPLQTLIRSSLARDWFDYSVERKKGAWLIKESDLKQVPVPKHLGEVLGKLARNEMVLPPHEEQILGMISTEPDSALKAIESLPHLKGHAFVHASQTLVQLEEHQNTLFSLISPDEQIRYSDFFRSVMTEKDLTGVHQHPLIRYNPTLTPHQAIQVVTSLKTPVSGILLGTAKGLTQTLYIQDQWLRDRCFEMIENLRREIPEPTWAEITQRIVLPRNPDQAQVMAGQILKAYSSEKLRRRELNHLISVCLAPRKESADKIGLLQ